MKKIYSYDPKRFQSILDRHRLRQIDVQHALGYTNSLMVRSWRSGNDLYAEKVCIICNTFGIDIHEFFVPTEDDKPEEYQTDFEKSLAGKKEEKEIANTEAEQLEEKSSQESYAENIMGIEYLIRKINEAREAERKHQEELRKAEREDYERRLQEAQKRFEEALISRNSEILEEQKRANNIELQKKELEMKMEELSRQYKELELSTLKNRQITSTGVAENERYLAANK